MSLTEAKCVKCYQRFVRRVDLVKHQENKSECQPAFKCKYCDKRFTNGESRMLHEFTAHNTKRFVYDGEYYPHYDAIFNAEQNEVK